MLDELLTLMFREEWRALPNPDRPEPAWTAAAAALNAGEPARARRLLGTAPVGQDPDVAAVVNTLGRLVEVVDRNWYPGGEAAVMTGDDLDVLLEERTVAAPTPDARLFVEVAKFVEALPTWRRGVEDGPDGGRWVLDASLAALNRIRRAGRPAAVAPVALAVADLHVRSGLSAAGLGLFRLARRAYRAASDRVGLAACALVLGDWAADPATRPETLSELLEPRPVTRRPGDPRRAADHWAAAEAGYRAAGAARGVVAVAVRRAAFAAADGRPNDAVATLAAVADGAAATGDGALTRLVAVHLALAAAQAGKPVDHAAVADEVAGWAVRDGSTSYARGLARLCRARAQRWKGTDVTASGTADLLARRVVGRIGTPGEVAILSADQVDRYNLFHLHRAALVLALSELDSGPAAPSHPVEWARLATLVMAASVQANSVREPAALPRIARHAGALLDCRPAGADGVVREFGDALERIVAERPVLAALWEAAAARATADPELARALLERAERAALRSAPLLLIPVLAAAGRHDDAAALVGLYERQGLADEHVATMYARLGRFPEALVVLDRIDRRAGPHLPMKPWEIAHLRAEVLLGVGRPDEARAPAALAVAELERHLAALDLDVFRSMATDDPVAAGVYTTAVRVHAELARDGDPAHMARGAELSDRARAAGLGDLLRPDPSAGPETRAAARAWQRAGASLARTVEEISAGLDYRDAPPPARIRARMAAAERDLNTTDAVLTGTHVVRRRLPETPPLADIQHRLAPGTLLLQYHAYDDRLIAWAVTPETARVTVGRFATVDLTAAAFAFHRAASRPGIPNEEWDRLTASLTPLLDPFTDDIRRCDRVVVVPHGPLSAVPFHLLPFDAAPLDTADRPVSYLPAASVAPQRPTGVRTGSLVLVVGDPAYGRGHDPLPGTRVEALEVARRWGTVPYLSADASRATVLAAAPGAGLVHLATHGSFRAGSPYSTELVLAGADGLTVPDLMGLGLRADLVVLSACDSGRGRPTAAGDLIGLTRALLAAGARELVVSLWPVDDRIACLTMTAFHEHLRDGPGSVGTALAAARNRIRSLTPQAADEAYAALGGDPDRSGPRTSRDLGASRTGPVDPADPCHWAPFVHIGTS